MERSDCIIFYSSKGCHTVMEQDSSKVYDRRLVEYESYLLNKENFNDDTKGA